MDQQIGEEIGEVDLQRRRVHLRRHQIDQGVGLQHRHVHLHRHRTGQEVELQHRPGSHHRHQRASHLAILLRRPGLVQEEVVRWVVAVPEQEAAAGEDVNYLTI